MAIGEPRSGDHSQSDEALAKRVRNGERELFSVLVDRYKRGIASFISAGVRSPADVADLSQETFMRAFAHLDTFNPALGKFSTWIYQIARNVVRTHLGKSRRRVPTQDLPEDQSLENALPDLSLDSDPSGGVLREESERELRAALDDLPERTRTVLALRYFNNMEYHTIASTLGLSLGNVKTLIHRGKIALAQKMREREGAAEEMLRQAQHDKAGAQHDKAGAQHDKAGARDDEGEAQHDKAGARDDKGLGKGGSRALLVL